MHMKVNTLNLRRSHQTLWLTVDFMMLGLLTINITWLIFDSLYAVDGIHDLLLDYLPELTDWYAPIHRRFFFYDLIFVSIFLLEFVLRWIHAVYVREYARWYFYPFIHWYDLVGCIPAGGYRFLRVLRLFSILYRLHKYEIIDFTNTRVFVFVKFYYEAFMEELSDRIVIKVLSGMQEEVSSGSPLVHQIQQKVLLPRRQLLVDWLSEKVALAAQQAYLPHQEIMRRYLSVKVDQAIEQNNDVKKLQMIPILGGTLSDTLERAVADIVAHVIDHILKDLSSAENHQFIEDIAEVFLHEKPYEKGALDQEIISATVELLELVKHQVNIKRWHAGLGGAERPHEQVPREPAGGKSGNTEL